MQRCRDAGIDVKMITGDNIETARAIGREIGLLDRPTAIAMTSDEFNALSDDELRTAIDDVGVATIADALRYDFTDLVRLGDDLLVVARPRAAEHRDTPTRERA